MTVPAGEELHVLEELAERPPVPECQPSTALSELTPGIYVNTVVRVVAVRCREKEDELGSRICISGFAEDLSFRVPFVCYKPYHTFFKDSVFRFEGAYVHMFEDHSLLLVLTEHSRITYLPEEDPENYVWKPRIGSINRPLGRCRITLEGIVSNVYNNSGLVKRCEKCSRVVNGDRCPECGESRWFWSVRISSRLSDSTGSINTVFPQYLTCKLLGRSISEILCLAEAPNACRREDFTAEVYHVKPLEKLPIVESTVVEPASFKQCEKLVVPDYNRSKIYNPRDVTVDSKQVLDVKDRLLEYSAREDRALYEKIIEKAIDIEIRRRTSLPKVHGIYLTEPPVPLYWAEKAKVHLGFEVHISTRPNSLKVEFCPAALVRESVLDYIVWRRNRGASVKAIEKCLLKWMRNVILAPNGTLGEVKNILYGEAGNFTVPNLSVSLPEFWRTAYDLKVEPEEKPLLVVKPYNVDANLTYPPSCAFYDEQTIRVRSSVLNYVEEKKLRLRRLVSNLSFSLMTNLSIGCWNVETFRDEEHGINAQRLILQEVKRKLLGRRVKACGSVFQTGRLYFIPKTIIEVC